MPGSLLCFSDDNFKSFFFGTVADDRDRGLLKHGKLGVKFEYEHYSSFTNLISKAEAVKGMIIMIEPETYYEVKEMSSACNNNDDKLYFLGLSV